MLTYQVRRRVLKLEQDANLEFPAEAVVRLHLLPKQPFGESAEGGRTTVRAKAATAYFNANTGAHHIVSKEPLQPLDVLINEPTRTTTLNGRVFELTQTVESVEEMLRITESLFFGLPWLLNLDFGDPPYVERVEGSIAGISFRWELADWALGFEMTTQSEQEESAARAYLRFETVSATHRRRLMAALHYFHVARRLERAGMTAGEFLSEMLLNLAKCLEALFPGKESIDAARSGLTNLGFSESEIESHYVPVLALRNQIDVGHVHLSLLTLSQLAVLHTYLHQAEFRFKDLFNRVFDRIESGEWDVPEYLDPTPSPEVVKVIERMQSALDIED